MRTYPIRYYWRASVRNPANLQRPKRQTFALSKKVTERWVCERTTKQVFLSFCESSQVLCTYVCFAYLMWVITGSLYICMLCLPYVSNHRFFVHMYALFTLCEWSQVLCTYACFVYLMWAITGSLYICMLCLPYVSDHRFFVHMYALFTLCERSQVLCTYVCFVYLMWAITGSLYIRMLCLPYVSDHRFFVHMYALFTLCERSQVLCTYVRFVYLMWAITGSLYICMLCLPYVSNHRFVSDLMFFAHMWTISGCLNICESSQILPGFIWVIKGSISLKYHKYAQQSGQVKKVCLIVGAKHYVYLYKKSIFTRTCSFLMSS